MKRAALLLVLVAGCAGSPPPPTEYLLSALRQPPTGQRSYESVDIALGRIDVAAYLDRDGIVIETADGRLQAARGHVWAEPLQQSLRRLLQTGIATGTGKAVAERPLPGTNTVIDVAIEYLHGTEDGRVLLVATWTTHGAAGEVTGHHRLVREQLTRADGYAALVAAHEALLDELAAAIAASLPS